MSRFTYRDEHGNAQIFPEFLRRKPYEFLEKIAHYEDLEAEGRLIELPCKFGDKVYCLNYKRWKEDGKYKYKELWVRESFLRLEYIPYFGKTVFLTKAEAEQKLAELKEGEL